MVGQRPVDGLAVNCGYGGYVVGRLEAPLDLEGAEAEPDELGDFIDGGQVLRGEEIRTVAEIAGLAVDFQ